MPNLTQMGALALMGLASTKAMLAPNAPIDTVAGGALQQNIYIQGGPFNHKFVDQFGYTVVDTESDPKAHKWFYATTDVRGKLMATDKEVGNVNPWTVQDLRPGITAVLEPEVEDALHGIAQTTKEARNNLRRRLATIGETTIKNLVLRIRFNDHQTRPLPTKGNHEDLMSKAGKGCTRPTINANYVPKDGDCVTPTGSVKDLYLENSYGKLTIDSTVTEWITVSNTEKQVGNGCSSTCNRASALHSSIYEALQIASQTYDFRDFDGDNDGVIDMFTIIHSGYGAEYGQPDSFGTSHEDRVWSHKWQLGSARTIDGVRISTYHINPGVWGLENFETSHIGVVAHESGHFLGLPDLYDTDQTVSGSGLGTWGLMGNSWGFDGSQDYPPMLSAWSKIDVNFVEPTVLTETTTINLKDITKTGQVLKINHGYEQSNGKEYILIENRQDVFYKENDSPATTVSGIFVWKIDDSKDAGNQNNAKEGYPGSTNWPSQHYHVALQQADGLYQLDKGRVRGDVGDLYSEGQEISDTTTPSLNSYSYMTCAAQSGFKRGLSGNRIQVGATNADGSVSITYTKSATCNCSTDCATDPEPPTCNDEPQWHDSRGEQYTCQWYATTETRCDQFGDDFAYDGKTAKQACCKCGGSDGEVSTPSPTAPETGECVSLPAFATSGGRTCPEFNAFWCWIQGGSTNADGVTAREACCECGGGSTSSRGPELTGADAGRDNAGAEPVSVGAPLAGGLVAGLAVGGLAGGLFVKHRYTKAQASKEERVSQNILAGKPTFEDL